MFVFKNIKYSSIEQNRTLKQLQLQIAEQEKQIVDLNLKVAELLKRTADVSYFDSKKTLNEHNSSIEKTKRSN